MSAIGSRKWWLRGLLALPLLLVFYYMCDLTDFYTLHMPQAPVPASNRTIPMTVYFNRIVYVTSSEKHRLQCLRWVSGIGFVGFFSYVIGREIWSQRGQS